MKAVPIDPFLWAVRIGGMHVFVVTITASIVTLTCALENTCGDQPLMPLWLHSGIGSVVLIAATAGYTSSRQRGVGHDSGNLE